MSCRRFPTIDSTMQYLLLIHRGGGEIPAGEWEAFFERARESGLFRGGSELGARWLIGAGSAGATTDHLAGFMRFDAEDRGSLLELLQAHPVVRHGGTVELCEMPLSREDGDGG